MCGIVGTSKAHYSSIAAAMKVLAHRGPDADGLFDANVTFGHRRLSIIDLSEHGTQPLSSKSGRTVTIYNGEIYNYQLLRAELESEGSVFLTDTDTEVILEGYERHGVTFFNRLRGMWAFAIHDMQKDTIVLSRDQFGIKPLYYSLFGRELCFASEMKVFKTFDILLSPNTSAYPVFFELGYFVAPDTCYKEVKTLIPGEVLTFNCQTKAATFTKLSPVESHVDEPVLTEESEIIDALDRVLRDSVAAHYVADVPVGLLFSGGSDSSLLAALSHAIGKTPKAFHLSIAGSIDTEYALQIGRNLNLSFESIEMTEAELIVQYDAIWDIVDVPFADMSVIPTSLIFKKIQGKSKVVLSGEGGDEWFGGYQRHGKMMQAHRIQEKNLLLSMLYGMYGDSEYSLRYVNPFIARLKDTLLTKYSNDVIGQYLNNIKVVDYSIGTTQARAEFYKMWHNDSNQHPGLFFDETSYLPNDLLYKNDISSMASSIEARVPLVDKEVSRFVHYRIPKEFRLSKQYSHKYLLKKVLEQYLPQELVYRKKTGFSFSFNRYDVPAFKEDAMKALKFHQQNADMFGVKNTDIFNPKSAEVLIKKYPRFVFGLVSNYKIIKG